ncbi:uncharacterized protein LOC112590198 [Harpegnathos saltator]|uniref:uncharacterized protein LOC112590198 n=1 Tax=Harpegnathos saltator TaxID=610380 RepID=UPI000DBEE67B|nr:uncharacterized protein LOC112590198 [Harpegnathos saltator]
MKSTWNRYYDVTKRLSLLTGQWPYQNKRNRMLRTGVIMSNVLVINVPQMCKFIQCDGDVECILRVMPSYMLMIVIMLKTCLCQYKSSKMRILTKRVIDDWENLQTPEEYEIMKMYATGAKWLVLAYSAVCLIGVAIFMAMALISRVLDIVLPLNESRPVTLPFEAYYFVDERKYFFYIFSQGFLAGVVSMMGLVAYDTMFMTFVEHVCGTFAVAGFRFEHLMCESIDIIRVVNNTLDKVYNQRMAHCVKIHWAALE